MRATAAERFAACVSVDLATGCWIWMGCQRGKGYGCLRVNGRMMRAHRYSYELHVGPIPAGLQIDHLCRNRLCVNPAHLEPVVNRVNVLRGVGVTAQNAKKTHCRQGHEFTPENTRITDGARVCRACNKVWDRNRRPRRPAAERDGGKP